MNHDHQIYTSDAGSVSVDERHILFGLHWFARHNVRPVSPTCKDHRIERGLRVGTWCLVLRRTKREYAQDYPAEWLETPL